MKLTHFKLFLVIVLSGSIAFSGTIRSHGTAGASQLLIPVGAENIALSTANVATVAGVEAMYLNPAGVAKLGKGFQGLASTMNYIADIKLSYVGVVTKLGKTGSFGLAIKSLDFGDIPVTTADATEGTGEMYSPAFMSGMLNYSKSFADRVQFGANFKLISEQIINTGATGFAVDLGVQYRFTDLPVSMGVVLRNLGNRMEYAGSDLEQNLTPEDAESGSIRERFRVKSESFELPASLDISVDYEAIPGLALMGAYRNNSFAANQTIVAAKYTIAGIGWVAGGTSMLALGGETQPDDISESVWDEWTQSPFGMTFGAGVNIPLGAMNLGVAYSVRTVTDYFENNNTVQLTLDF